VSRPPVLVQGDTPFYRLVRGAIAVTLAPAHRIEAQGTEYLPSRGPALIAVNHKSDVDPFYVGVCFNRPLRFLAKAELFDNRAVGWAVGHLGSIPLHRGESDRRALEACLACLANGEALLMFPEGTRFDDDAIHPFQPGIGMLALRSGAPVVPAAVDGTRGALRGRPPRFTKVRVAVGPPVDLSGLEGRRSVAYTAASERIERAVKEIHERLIAER
jgi:1-acyl-sn-glycerol-3-phosphate acyltransferase